ncbi:hypothetical protein D3C72_2007610 [compost metagenome]
MFLQPLAASQSAPTGKPSPSSSAEDSGLPSKSTAWALAVMTPCKPVGLGMDSTSQVTCLDNCPLLIRCTK